MLDTDTSSYVIRGQSPHLDANLARVPVASVCVSTVTRAELRFGVRRLMPHAHRLAAEVERFLCGIRTLAWDEAAADAFARVRSRLEAKGRPIGVMDMMIAAHALAASAVLVTNNTRHFSRVTRLVAENWLKEESR